MTQAFRSAVHVELVRRLDAGLPEFTGLADLVLRTPLPGRGPVDIPVAGDARAAYGTPSADPEGLDPEQLLRLSSAVLAGLVRELPAVSHEERRPRLWARRFRVSGAPVVREQVRAALRAKGWRESKRGGTHVVIGAPIPDGFGQVWTHRVGAGGAMSWGRMWQRQRDRGQVPAPLRYDDLRAAAATTGGQVLAVHGTAASVRTELGQRLGIDLPEVTDLLTVDVARRANWVLGTGLRPADHRALMPRLIEVVGRATDPVTELDVPRMHRDWAAGLSGTGGADYAHSQVSAPDGLPAERTLSLSLAAIGRAWRRKVEA